MLFMKNLSQVILASSKERNGTGTFKVLRNCLAISCKYLIIMKERVNLGLHIVSEAFKVIRLVRLPVIVNLAWSDSDTSRESIPFVQRGNPL